MKSYSKKSEQYLILNQCARDIGFSLPHDTIKKDSTFQARAFREKLVVAQQLTIGLRSKHEFCFE